jgi:DNA-binding FrmR family transcriptional regulator
MDETPEAPAAAATRYWDPADIERRLHRVEGQVRGLAAMVLRGAGCAEVLTQIRAIQGALTSVERIIEMCSAAERIERDLGPFDVQQMRRALRKDS